MCVCVRACVRVCVCVCMHISETASNVCVCVCVCARARARVKRAAHQEPEEAKVRSQHTSAHADSKTHRSAAQCIGRIFW
jgi:hypothetical protein